MITHISHRYTNQVALQAFLNEKKNLNAVSSATAVLVQIFSAETSPQHVQTIAAQIREHLPQAIIVGATTVGEISEGYLLTGSTIIGMTCFEHSSLFMASMPCQSMAAHLVGTELGRQINQIPGNVVGVLLLATPLSIDGGALLQGIRSSAGHLRFFGGGAGDYAAMNYSLVFTDDMQYSQGVIAVVLTGDNLHIESSSYLGWRPLSRSMQVTAVDQLLIQTIDGKPAFDVYQHYLNIPNDKNFFLNALEFPFLVERQGELLARVPIAAMQDGALQFVADIQEGEYFRLGYGDMDLITRDAQLIHQAMAKFSPQAIFLYSCGCRRFLMQNDVELETRPFESIAPTFGFYTYGEFYSSNSLQLLNSTMVAVGLREGDINDISKRSIALESGIQNQTSDPYANKHTRIVARLMRFIDAVTVELEDSNREITKLSRTDPLTQLVNRIQLDQVLNDNLQSALRDKIVFSIILLDLDHFKSINDLYGHLVGDEVLVSIAKVLTTNTHPVNTIGRWGGEEFLIVLPNSDSETAKQLAENLLQKISTYDFPIVETMTASFGITSFVTGDDIVKMINRADVALYTAKHSGRNRIELSNMQP